MDSPFFFIGDLLAIDFVNTEIVRDGERVDLLTTPADVFAWLAGAGVAKDTELASLRRSLSPKELDRFLVDVKAFRAEMRKAVDAIARGAKVPPAALHEINRYLNIGAGELRVRATDSRYELVEKRRFESTDALLAPIARSMADLLCAGDHSLVRQCEGARCILYFLDISKAHRRRWCSMSACGNRAKVAAHYERKRESAG